MGVLGFLRTSTRVGWELPCDMCVKCFLVNQELYEWQWEWKVMSGFQLGTSNFNTICIVEETIYDWHFCFIQSFIQTHRWTQIRHRNIIAAAAYFLLDEMFTTSSTSLRLNKPFFISHPIFLYMYSSSAFHWCIAQLKQTLGSKFKIFGR